jgi:DNA-binding GntR family transcriptional regulator
MHGDRYPQPLGFWKTSARQSLTAHGPRTVLFDRKNSPQLTASAECRCVKRYALEAEGLVVNRPNRGVVVAPLDPNDALEIFDIHASLESLALRRSIPRLDDRRKVAAAAALKTLEQAAPEQASNAHRAFHLSLSAAAGDRLQKLIGQYIDAAARYLRVEATLVGTVDEDRYEHRVLLETTLAGDVRGATRLIERHVAGTGSELAEVLRDRDRVRRATQK